MNYIIREINQNEYSLLNKFIYEAIFIDDGDKKPDTSIIYTPEFQVYIEEFGIKKDDFGLVTEVDKKIVGAAWVRIMDDYGHVDNETPSLAISVLEKYRGYGIGTNMLKKLLSILKFKGYKQTSLSVQKNNYAFKMYESLGYQIVAENADEYIMVCTLN